MRTVVNKIPTRFFGFNPILCLIGVAGIVASLFFLTGENYQYAILPGLFFLLLLLLWHKPELGFFAVLFLIPFEQYTGLSEAYKFLTFPKVVGILTTIIFILKYLSDRSSEFDLQSNLWPLLIVFFSVWVLCTFLSDFPETSLKAVRRLITAYTMFVLGLAFLSSKRIFVTLPILIITSTSISALISIYGFIADDPLFMMDITQKYLRYAGGVKDPNEFATMQIFALPFLAFMLWASQKKTRSFFILGLICICLISIVLTYSRAGGVTLVAILFFLFLQYVKNFNFRKIGFFLLFSAAVAAIIFTSVPGSYWERQRSLTNTKTDFSIGRRLSYLVFAYEQFKKNPIFGHGPAAFEKMYATSRWSLHFGQSDRSKGRVAHNTFVEIVIGMGLVGLTIYISIIMLTFRNFYFAWKSYKSIGCKTEKQITVTFAISFTVLLISFLFLSQSYHKYFWVVLAISQINLRHSVDKVKKA